ncbi:hypothetical protein Shyhy01_28630 [Streptomyces hygroscopicus subsp. hygroscopicus]|nr:hypothetical protein Shyhy01_28630 [Streptomyces hygroscopicus subsp. hygroscopicus]
MDLIFTEEQHAAAEDRGRRGAAARPARHRHLCAVLGPGERVLDMTGEHTGAREQFKHPAAAFQAVAVQAAERYIDLRAMPATRHTPSAPPGGPELPAVQTAQHLHGGSGADNDSLSRTATTPGSSTWNWRSARRRRTRRARDTLAAHPLG